MGYTYQNRRKDWYVHGMISLVRSMLKMHTKNYGSITPLTTNGGTKTFGGLGFVLFWLDLNKHILTWENRMKRGFIGFGICNLCWIESKMIGHLFIYCSYT